MAQTPTSPDSLLASSPPDRAAELRALRDAHPQLAAHLARGVEPAKALRHFGLTAWSRDEPALAVEALQAAAALAPEDAAIWADLSGAHYACAQLNDARACLGRSLALDDDAPARWLSFAALHRAAKADADAEAAFQEAIRRDPGLHDAWVGLGILLFQQRRLPQAVAALREAIRLGSRNVAVHACLGESLYLQGDVAGAAEAYAAQVASGPAEATVLRKYAFLRFLATAIAAPLAAALEAYRAAAGALAEDEQTVIDNGFHALSGYGYREAALRCGRARLARAPDDPVPRYLVDALEGAPVARAPEAYLVRYFDGFAESFDRKLVEVLGYRIPQEMRDALAAVGGSFHSVLDAGCGTGLVGALLAAPRRRLTGVDLSPGMLAKAAARGVYDRLVEAEIHAFLETAEESFDLIVAADVLVYIGDLAPLMAGAARRLVPGGVLCFSVETTEAADFWLHASGRFAHRPAYLETVARGLFSIERSVETQIRLDALAPAMGRLVVMRRLGS